MTLNKIKNIKSNMKEHGFTIVELLIVIIVIGILATLVLVSYNNVQSQARDTKRQGDASSLRDASASYKVLSANGAYPRNDNGGKNFQSDLATITPQTVTVDSSVSAEINSATLSGASPYNNYINMTYCPVAPKGSPATTYISATGVKFTYWKENGSTTASVSTGTGC